MYFMYLVYSIRNEFKVISYFEEIAIEKFKLNTSKKIPRFPVLSSDLLKVDTWINFFMIMHKMQWLELENCQTAN